MAHTIKIRENATGEERVVGASHWFFAGDVADFSDLSCDCVLENLFGGGPAFPNTASCGDQKRFKIIEIRDPDGQLIPFDEDGLL